ncbi:hypothetical protein BDZ89DRAFT_1069402 [Hymenopellis radicata]|nr:hypothetical protein BDZ89DRAFT_1069402 [Hymenopellis radicata]
MRFTAAYLAIVTIALVDARPQELTVPTESPPTGGSAIGPLPTSSPSLSFSLPGPISVSHLPLSHTTLTSPTRSTTVTSASGTSSRSSTAEVGASSNNAAVPAGKLRVEGVAVGFVAGLMALLM